MSLRLELAAQRQIAATLTAAIISAGGRKYSVAQILELQRDMEFALYPDHNSGAYQSWAKTKDERLSKVWGE